MSDKQKIEWLQKLYSEHLKGFPLTDFEEKFCRCVIQYTWKTKKLRGKQHKVFSELHEQYSELI